MTRLILHIGPLRTGDGELGLTAFLLVPGNADHPVAFAADLAGAAAELRQMAEGDDLVCEPALGAEGARLGLGTAPLDREACEMLATMALDIVDRSAFASIARDELIGHFCEAAAAFEQRMRRGWPREHRHIEVVSADEIRAGVVMDGPGLAILDAPDPAPGDAPDVTDGLGAVFAPGDPAVEDALHRAFGLVRVPQPFRVRAGAKLPLRDEELALLVATLFAASELGPDGPRSASGHVSLDGLSVKVTVAAV